MNNPFLEVSSLVKHFPLSKDTAVYAVDGVTFSIGRGETLGLVGESGCGKTTVGRSILRLIEPDSGKIFMNGIDILSLKGMEMFKTRTKMQIIFQDPFSSLNPRKNVEKLISEPLLIHKPMNMKGIRDRTFELIRLVGLTDDMATKYPHELDGGRCQRIGVARALALEPEFIVCDEPVSALDVSIQAQILNLLKELQKSMNLTYLFISHDLSVVKHLSSRICVMYLGKIVELAETEELFNNPVHPYTKALLSAIPEPVFKKDRTYKKRIILSGDVPTPINPSPGCRFAKRCYMKRPECYQKSPHFYDIGNGHLVSCLKINPGFGGIV